jgi:teichuronic acid biosynthesis glycosyltransferase TuaC
MEAVRLLTFSTLFPHAARPNHGIFVENRLRHLVASGEATSFVLAPVPWFPSRSKWLGEWAVNARAPTAEIRHGIAIDHPFCWNLWPAARRRSRPTSGATRRSSALLRAG